MPEEQYRSNVVLVHGLWFGRWAMSLMARRLRRAGFRTRSFSYSTTGHDLARQVNRLFRFSSRENQTLPHFVAHSMGGLITLQMLAEHPQLPAGRVVLMGSPLRGSSVARKVSHWPGGRKMLGAAKQTLIEGIQGWPHKREIGMIAGTRKMGLGVLAGGAVDHGDGTVLAEESRHEALDDYIEIPASHTSMLFSAEAARQAVRFLRHGRFSH